MIKLKEVQMPCRCWVPFITAVALAGDPCACIEKACGQTCRKKKEMNDYSFCNSNYIFFDLKTYDENTQKSQSVGYWRFLPFTEDFGFLWGRTLGSISGEKIYLWASGETWGPTIITTVPAETPVDISLPEKRPT